MKLKHVLQRLWLFTKADAAVLAGLGVLILIASSLEVVGPFLIKSYIDDYLTHGIIWSLEVAWLLAGYIGSVLLGGGLVYYISVRMSRISLNVVERLRDAIFSRVTKLPFSQINTTPIGSLVSRVTNDTEAVKELFVEVIESYAKNGVLLLAVVIAMVLLDWRLAAVAITLIPVIITLMWLYRHLSTPVFTKSRDLLAAINANLNESIAGMAAIRASGQREAFSSRFEQLAKDQVDARVRTIHYDGLLLRPMVDLLYVLALSAVLWIFGVDTSSNTIEVGAVYAATVYLGRFTEPLIDMTMKLKLFQQSVVSAERVFLWLDKPVEEWPETAALPSDNTISFNNISFSYPGATIPALSKFSAQVDVGEWVGIVGHTGSGKSTLLSLLLRHFRVDSGAICVGGVPLEKLSEAELRQLIIPLPQEPFLLATNVRDNIDLGRGYSDAQITTAIMQCELATELDGARALMHQSVTEDGTNFSVGQRQLICLARAIISKPKILLLDELTANIDSETEAAIERLIYRLKGATSVISIAHRLATIQRADRILVLHRGELVEQGAHRELIQRDGLYRRLYDVQKMD